jgi:hypothetical protein
MKTMNAVAAAAMIAMFSLPSFAQGVQSTPRIDQRQAEQERRIDRGVRMGLITPREEQRLREEQRHIRREERRAMADGHMSREERRHIDHLQDQADRHIEHEMRDRQRR